MSSKIWTYDTLAQASPAELEKILCTGESPDMEELNGYTYCGWNHDWIGYLTGQKFKKGFKKKDGKNIGYNEMVIQDSSGYLGKWNQRIESDGKPMQLGYFRTAYVKDEPPGKLNQRYINLGYFNYDIRRMDRWYCIYFKVIRDFLVLPNAGDNSLLLGKTYLRIFPSLDIFACYFQLGHREEIQYPPW
ncbi:MAG: hypothetical protein ACLP05_01145 [Candidatus Kryptoniota bacterium]